jgi:hypothetical protein
MTRHSIPQAAAAGCLFWRWWTLHRAGHGIVYVEVRR